MLSLSPSKVLPLLVLWLLGMATAHNEVLNLLLGSDLALSKTEIEALRPFFVELQVQYDFLHQLSLQSSDGSNQLLVEQHADPSYEQAFAELRAQFANYSNEQPIIVYDTKLPTAQQLIDNSERSDTVNMSELEDLQSIMQDVIDEAQEGIDELVQRAIDFENELLKLNKPKIVEAAFAGLGFMWRYWGRASRSAYCSYSHVPNFVEMLNAVNGGVQCYNYTMELVLRVQHETVDSVKEIKRNVFDLVKIYKKIAAKKTITGKIMSGTLNLFKALRRVHDIIAVGIDGYDKINNELPNAVLKTKHCGVEFKQSVPHMVETAKNLTSCIVFVDNDKPDYDFVKPEEDRYWNTGEPPAKIPHEDDEDDGEDDDDNDDYVDHR